jgi:hypothetical protein
MSKIDEIKRKEEYLFKIAKKVLKWADYTKYKNEELADLVMLELLNIKS